MQRTLKYQITWDNLQRSLDAVADMVRRGLPGGPVLLTLGREKRTLDQNAKQWAMLRDISQQLEWHGRYLSKEEWKNVLTAALVGQDIVPGAYGGYVVLGKETRKMDKEEFAELIELYYAFGTEHGVEWSEKALEMYERYGRKID